MFVYQRVNHVISLFLNNPSFFGRVLCQLQGPCPMVQQRNAQVPRSEVGRQTSMEPHGSGTVFQPAKLPIIWGNKFDAGLD
jgi:hypothetical protein